jgi:hypothetical protein
MGCSANVLATRREVLAHSPHVASILTVFALELTQMLLFASLVVSGIWLRNRPEYHKRLMLLATFCILPNPVVRLFIWAGFGSNIVILTVWSSLLLTIVLLESIRNRRLHPAFTFGATITIARKQLARQILFKTCENGPEYAQNVQNQVDFSHCAGCAASFFRQWRSSMHYISCLAKRAPLRSSEI